MEQAKALKAAIELIGAARKEAAGVSAIWGKLNRAQKYLDAQLAAELTNW